MSTGGGVRVDFYSEWDLVGHSFGANDKVLAECAWADSGVKVNVKTAPDPLLVVMLPPSWAARAGVSFWRVR